MALTSRTKKVSVSTKTAKVAKVAKKPAKTKSGTETDSHILRLNGPGMTPMLQAGLGGLAASLRAIHLQEKKARWPATVAIADGHAEVHPNRIVLHFGGDPRGFFEALFERAFTLHDGLIHIPAWHNARNHNPGHKPLLAIELQRALKRTFLQHGKATDKDGAEVVRTIDCDGETQAQVKWQSYSNYAHRKEGAKMALEALTKGKVSIAGWVSPGAAQRHVGFAQSKWEYNLENGLCALFSMVGCVSLQATGNAGALIVPVPANLVEFAKRRWQMTPESPADVVVGGTGDGVLRTMFALRQGQEAETSTGVRSVTGYVLRTTVWASQQKSRVAMVATRDTPQEALALYAKALAHLPNKLRLRNESKKAEDNYFYSTSALRAFIAENLANGRPWHTGFATARGADKDARFIHYYRTRDNLGALFPDERKGLWVMIEDLEVAEGALVRSVHEALKQRLAVIWGSDTASVAAKKKQSANAREEWRLLFAGAKTMEQTRNALARVWSSGGYGVQALHDHWQDVLPLLRQERWQTARDLALIGLASYKSRKEEEAENAAEDTE